MAYTFSKGAGHRVGNSLVENDFLPPPRTSSPRPQAKGVEVICRSTTWWRPSSRRTPGPKPLDGAAVPAGKVAMDVGPKTLALCKTKIALARKRRLERPAGSVRVQGLRQGHLDIAQMVRLHPRPRPWWAAAIRWRRSTSSASRTRSTMCRRAGGASLEFLEGKVLPGIKALE